MTNQKSAIETERDCWFYHQVRSTSERVESGQVRLIPHEELWEEIEAYARQLSSEKGGSERGGA